MATGLGRAISRLLRAGDSIEPDGMELLLTPTVLHEAPFSMLSLQIVYLAKVIHADLAYQQNK